MTPFEININALEVNYPSQATRPVKLSVDELVNLYPLDSFDEKSHWATKPSLGRWNRENRKPKNRAAHFSVYVITEKHNHEIAQMVRAYADTSYQAQDNKGEIVIRIGQINPNLALVLQHYKLSGWAYITAVNPQSVLLTKEDNNRRNQLLAQDLNKYVYLHGHGLPQNDNWLPEPSYLVLGISLQTALKLGSKYKQNAIVYGTKTTKARLVFCPCFSIAN